MVYFGTLLPAVLYSVTFTRVQASPAPSEELVSRGTAGGLNNLGALYGAVKEYLKDRNAYVS